MTTCIKKNQFFHATGHTSPTCYVACQKPQSPLFNKISFEQKKTDKMTSNDQTMRDSPCSQTESYSTVFFLPGLHHMTAQRNSFYSNCKHKNEGSCHYIPPESHLQEGTFPFQEYLLSFTSHIIFLAPTRVQLGLQEKDITVPMGNPLLFLVTIL